MSILQLSDAPAYTVGSTFMIPRRSLARTPETVTATVDRVRRGSNEWIYTLQVHDTDGRYGHWRVCTEIMLRKSIQEVVERGMLATNMVVAVA